MIVSANHRKHAYIAILQQIALAYKPQQGYTGSEVTEVLYA